MPELWSLRWLIRIPCINFTHRPLPPCEHDILLHLVDILLQIRILLLVLLDATLVDEHPRQDDDGGNGDCDGEVDPEVAGDNGVGALAVSANQTVHVRDRGVGRRTGLKVEEGHAENGGEICSREE